MDDCGNILSMLNVKVSRHRHSAAVPANFINSPGCNVNKKYSYSALWWWSLESILLRFSKTHFSLIHYGENNYKTIEIY